jgi:secondary thiamine-phosphate synthase enzyme
MQKLTYSTQHKTQMIDITDDVREAVIKSGRSEGAVLVFVPHSTCSIFISEHVDPNLTRDILETLHRHVPSSLKYHHVGDNANAHIKASLMGASVALPIENASLVMGEWQGIFLADFDGPRERTVTVKVLS